MDKTQKIYNDYNYNDYNYNDYDNELDDEFFDEQEIEEVIDNFLMYHSYDVILLTEKIQTDSFKCTSSELLDFILEYIVLSKNINESQYVLKILDQTQQQNLEYGFTALVNTCCKISKDKYVNIILNNNLYDYWTCFYSNFAH